MRKWLVRIFISGVVLFSLYPFVWMFLSSFKTNREIYMPTQLFPKNFDGHAYYDLLSDQYISFISYFTNSMVISGLQAFFATLVTAMAAFVFAKYNFRFQSLLFGVAILVILIPKQTIAVPLFDWMLLLGLQGSRWSMVLPGIASGLGIVFFTQSFKQIPNELIELAKVEGFSLFRTFLLIIPLFVPALLTYGLLHFILSWQEHLIPLLLLDDENITLPIALAKLRDSSHRIPEAVGMAAATISFIPIVVLFGFFFRKMKTALVDLSLS